MAEEKRRNPVVVGWIIAVVGLIIAFLLGWALMGIGSSRLAEARREQQPLRNAVSFMATEALGAAREAAAAVASSNWGEAQQRLTRVNEIVTGLERAKSNENARQIEQVRRALGQAQTAVGEQDRSARDAVDRLIAALEALQVKQPVGQSGG
jgi:biopolymer transport protein ExbB/TolQ